MTILNTCCGCCSLQRGTIMTGILGIISAFGTLIVILATKVKVKTIVLDNLTPTIVKIILTINLGMTVLISILLIIGAIKKKRWFILPWVVLAIILAIGLAVSVIYTSVDLYLHDQPLTATVGLVVGLIVVAIHIYLWLVVLSFYQSLKEEKNRGVYSRASNRTNNRTNNRTYNRADNDTSSKPVHHYYR